MKDPRIDGADQRPDTVELELVDDKGDPIEEEEEEDRRLRPRWMYLPNLVERKAREPEDLQMEQDEKDMEFPVSGYECYPEECLNRGGYQSHKMLQECAAEADIEFAKKVESLSPTDPNGVEEIPVKCVQFPINITCKFYRQRARVLLVSLYKSVFSYLGDIWKKTITKTMFGIVMLKYQKLHLPPNLPRKPQSSCLHMPRTRKDAFFSTGCSSSLKMI